MTAAPSTKRCPACAEEIHADAVKCKHCGERIDGAPLATPTTAPHADEEKQLIYEGTPSWRAYFGSYALLGALAPVALWGSVQIGDLLGVAWAGKFAAVIIPLVVTAAAFAVTTLVRRSVGVRITNRSLERSSGILSRRIEVVELWRIRDIAYRQSLLDRVLDIAHIDLFSTDVTTPKFEIAGMRASRELFEKIRDAIEIQRQSRRVMGLIE